MVVVIAESYQHQKCSCVHVHETNEMGGVREWVLVEFVARILHHIATKPSAITRKYQNVAALALRLVMMIQSRTVHWQLYVTYTAVVVKKITHVRK